VLFAKGAGGTELKTPPIPESKSVLDRLTSGKNRNIKMYTLFHYLVLCTVVLNISYNSTVTLWKNFVYTFSTARIRRVGH
jgi:hypothetical protein